ncbi:MAG: ABC transporter ATP-binding protein [Candidatus Aminicenantes bacterium]|nr:ABC transporter ATP-binding protein [Candidatus Aminicenantes bacterium]
MEILELKSVNKSFGALKAVDNLSVAIPEGKITSLIGPNGAGKTTIFNIISGFIKADKGAIFYQGEKINNNSPYQIACMGIGRLFQDVRVFDKLSVLDNVLLAKEDQPGENPFISLFNRKKMRSFEESNLIKAREWIEFVGLSEKEESLAEDLSFGQQKLLSLSRLLAGDSNLMLLDEPASGVHPAMLKDILSILKGLTRKGRTIILIEHDMRVVNEISDWVILLNSGKLVSFGLPDEIMNDEVLKEVYLGV